MLGPGGAGYDQAAVVVVVVVDQLLGGGVGRVKELVATELDRLGVAVSNALCEHFDVSRAELFEVVRVKGLTTRSTVLAERGRGRGCDRPTCTRTGRTASLRASRVAR